MDGASWQFPAPSDSGSRGQGLEDPPHWLGVAIGRQRYHSGGGAANADTFRDFRQDVSGHTDQRVRGPVTQSTPPGGQPRGPQNPVQPQGPPRRWGADPAERSRPQSNVAQSSGSGLLRGALSPARPRAPAIGAAPGPPARSAMPPAGAVLPPAIGARRTAPPPAATPLTQQLPGPPPVHGLPDEGPVSGPAPAAVPPAGAQAPRVPPTPPPPPRDHPGSAWDNWEGRRGCGGSGR